MSDRFSDDVTMAVFGDHDAGYGQTYSQIANDSPEDELTDNGFGPPHDFRFGKKRPEPK
jgi:hypothetical protein